MRLLNVSPGGCCSAPRQWSPPVPAPGLSLALADGLFPFAAGLRPRSLHRFYQFYCCLGAPEGCLLDPRPWCSTVASGGCAVALTPPRGRLRPPQPLPQPWLRTGSLRQLCCGPDVPNGTASGRRSMALTSQKGPPQAAAAMAPKWAASGGCLLSLQRSSASLRGAGRTQRATASPPRPPLSLGLALSPHDDVWSPDPSAAGQTRAWPRSTAPAMGFPPYINSPVRADEEGSRQSAPKCKGARGCPSRVRCVTGGYCYRVSPIDRTCHELPIECARQKGR